ncbi:MAG TPA: single-stranded-DNA-specific exonuclease RecJ [Gemmatimonadales bacterium]|nr:single-stranded-DNA-specific exonuclease RecJ [Gemmatimonadales bacterium]
MASFSTLRGEPLSRRWRLEAEVDDSAAGALAAALSVPVPFARLLVQRGYGSVETARRFLRPSRADLHDPFLLPDMDVAVERLARAVRHGETVLVHGDYDVDGQAATAILTRAIRHAGGLAVPFVPHRLRDGYDLGMAGVREAAERKASLIVALDCGTTAVESIRQALSRGIEVIVADHHLPGPERPPALALVNPRRPESSYPFPDLCGAALAWKLALALHTSLALGEAYVWHLVDLVALATVADLVPLIGENRVLTRLGLKVMKQTRWPGLAALIAESGLSGRTIRAGQVAFVLGPRINAAGRVGDAADGLRLLLSDDEEEAHLLARQLGRQNEERQALDQRTLEEALQDLESWFDPARHVGVVLAREGWHPGVIGIVASRVVERIARPTFLVALDGDLGKGSGRSVPRCDLHAALSRCSGHLERWGGHRMAAGLTVSRARLGEFRDAFNRAVGEQVSADQLFPTQRVDAVLSLADITSELERLLRTLEPTGMGNPSPVFGLKSVRLEGEPRPIGEAHVRLVLTDGERRLRTVAWGQREAVEAVVSGASCLDAAVKLELDTWMGRDTVEGRLVALAAS